MAAQKLIVIDDEKELCRYIRKVAEASGYEVRIATSGKEFLNVLDAYPPDVIIMDILIPDMDAFELIQQLSDRHCTAAIFVISGYENLYLEMAKKYCQAKNLNIVETFAKPVPLAVLSEALKKVSMGKSAPV